MKNFFADGKTLTTAAPAGGTVAGRIYVFGDTIGVALSTAAAGEQTVFDTDTKVYEFGKATGAAWTLGAKLYWDATNFVLTTTASGNTLVANAARAAAAGDTTGLAKIRPVAG